MLSLGDFVVVDGLGYLVTPTITDLTPIEYTADGNLTFPNSKVIKLTKDMELRHANKSVLLSLVKKHQLITDTQNPKGKK